MVQAALNYYFSAYCQFWISYAYPKLRYSTPLLHEDNHVYGVYL
jgi:hypothetical protein